MLTFLYDGSLEGFLTAIFEAYERKPLEYRIRKEGSLTIDMFGDAVTVDADKQKSARVWLGLTKKITAKGVGYLILQAEGVFDINTVIAGIVVLTVFALLLDFIVTKIEARLLVWRPQAAQTEAL